MFGKKNKETARKVIVKDESPKEQEVKINRIPENTCGVAPLVSIERHQLNVNGRDQKPTFRIAIGGRDVLTLTPREYNELFMEMLRHKDADELIHDISEVHAEEHAKAEDGLEFMGGLAEFLGKNMPPELAEILKSTK